MSVVEDGFEDVARALLAGARVGWSTATLLPALTRLNLTSVLT